MTTKQIVERLGGEGALGREVKTEIDLADAITEGLSAEAVDFVLDSEDLSAKEIYSLVGSRRTLTRKRRSRAKLSPGESERLARVARVISRAEEALGDPEKARRWLRTPNQALEGRTPIELLGTEAGSRLVERVLGRIEHGVYS